MITCSQCRAGRALAEISRQHLARLANLGVDVIADFERKLGRPDDAEIERLQSALEEVGIIFIPEDNRGAGVRLKFTRADSRRISSLEDEGGNVGDDDVPA